MINTKKPNTDDYTQVGFIEAKDGQGNYQNIDHIYDSEGNIVFQQGYLNEYDGANDFRIPAIGKPLIDYTIYGNTFQDGTPTPGNPVMPEGTGDRTGNLWDEEYPNISGTIRYVPLYVGEGSFTLSTTTPYDRSVANLFLLSGNVSTGASTSGNGAFIKHNVTAQSDGGYITIAYRHYTSTTSPADCKTMLNSGSTAIPYEPYGYKIPISSNGENLYNINAKDTNNGYVNNMQLNQDGTMSNWGYSEVTEYIELTPNATYTLSNIGSFNSLAYCIYDGNKQYITGVKYSGQLVKVINMPPNGKYLRFTHYKIRTDTMLNRGSTALPYSPYNRTTTPVHLGEVETTRKIKKIIFDGQDSSVTLNVVDTNRIVVRKTIIAVNGQGYCSHLGNNVSGNNKFVIAANTVFLSFDLQIIGGNTLADVNAYFAAQYAAGTPVTVWYVLATETTGIVNEPLMRIGDYADSVDFSQAGVQIPTLKRPNTTEIDITTSLPPSEVYAKYRGSKTQKYDLFLAANGDSFEAKNGQSLYIGDDT